jgi:protein xylosyltransferase
VFHQCENRMWRIANRSLPQGLQIDGGSDWFCLNYEFINYLVHSTDEYLIHLKDFFNFTLLPSEV